MASRGLLEVEARYLDERGDAGGGSRSGRVRIRSCCAMSALSPLAYTPIYAGALGRVAEVLPPGMSVAVAEETSGVKPQVAPCVLLSLLWHGVWMTDLTR